MTGPLEGVRVVELGVWVAGPGAGGILADWGADVVKVEPPQGDPARNFGRMLGGDLPTNPVFELDNRGKRSISLDLSSERGVHVVHDLVADADVLLTNLRPAALERLELGPRETCGRHPRLVYAIITGYGLEGPEAERGAYDIAAFWARAGIAESLRTPGGPLPFQRGGMGDHSVAMTGAAMVSAALVERARTGYGQLVSTSLLRQGVYTIGFDVNVAVMWGRTLGIGTRETMYSPVLNNYAASDGKSFWIVGLEGDRHWPALARAVGHDEWITDPRFDSARNRAVHARELIGSLDEIFSTRTLDEWATAFAEEPELFWSPVNTIDDVVADEQFHAAHAVVDVPDEQGTLPMLATPVDFDGRPPAPRWRAPLLGEHTREVLREMGLDEDATASLVADGVAVAP
ncbi:MAG TPA: CoA transferase [Acidimicrobiales bacterium]|jgi:crotonobetainyl-CoA:carnitine CoA-transferase CaiB-like acyl-CoA transferase|nr:CoA transferase [Acidimicrobiales bacterium]